MKASVVIMALILIALPATAILAREAADYIEEARELQNQGDIAGAYELMQAAAKEHPDDSNVNAYLGLFAGMMAGRTNDYMEAGRLVTESFEVLDKAVTLDHDNVLARYFRGIMGVNVPDFMGKRDAGIRDLQEVVAAREEDPSSVPDDIFIDALRLLGRALTAKGDTELAKKAYEELIGAVPGTEEAAAAQKAIEGIDAAEIEQADDIMNEVTPTPEMEALQKRIAAEPENAGLLVELGRAYSDAGYLDAAELVLKKATDVDSSNAAAYAALAGVLGQKAQQGYNEKIYEDTDYMTNLAFEMMRVTDKAVELDPDNLEMRLMRDIVGIQMPFFVGRLDDSIKDLNALLESDAPDDIKSQALFWLGNASMKKTMAYWTRVVNEYPDMEAAHLVYEEMKPPVEHINPSEYEKPMVIIDFVLGFRDELPPQTAVWVETSTGEFVKTVYVSGFSGFAKEQQINLPVWSSTSDFMDVDGVTAASIDRGEHIYVWDLKDYNGNRVQPGDYVVKVEVSYWPSMKYQMAEAAFTVGTKETKSSTEEGDFIPYLEVTYMP
jgi:tetratricopeptide (TPR) repeat protein